MGTATPTAETVNERLDNLSKTVKRLEKDVARLKKPEPLPKPRATATPPEYEEMIARQIATGFLMEPSEGILALIEELQAEWEAIPEEEKLAVGEELRNLRLDPPLSEVIIKLRQGWYPDESEWVE